MPCVCTSLTIKRTCSICHLRLTLAFGNVKIAAAEDMLFSSDLTLFVCKLNLIIKFGLAEVCSIIYLKDIQVCLRNVQ